jgi:hypothetical protein
VSDYGTARELRPIAEQVLAWVVAHRLSGVCGIHADDLRRIELCALATIEAAMFFDLYGVRTGRIDHTGGDSHAPAPQVQDEC